MFARRQCSPGSMRARTAGSLKAQPVAGISVATAFSVRSPYGRVFVTCPRWEDLPDVFRCSGGSDATPKKAQYNSRDMKGLAKRLCVGSDWRHTLVRAAVVCVVVAAVGSTFFLPFQVQGESMRPKYRTGDYGFINAFAYRWTAPRRFDIVGIRMAGTRIMYLKRIIGLPGETVAIRDGIVHVNGEALDEPYVTLNAAWNLPNQSLTGDEYFVVGDNRGVPMHQHTFGKVERRRLVGRVWPFRIALP